MSNALDEARRAYNEFQYREATAAALIAIADALEWSRPAAPSKATITINQPHDSDEVAKIIAQRIAEQTGHAV